MGSRVAPLLIIALLSASCLALPFPVNATPRTIVVPDDYWKISLAIANATDGDTVFVRNGTYIEKQININKAVSLVGENPEKTIIQLSYTYTTMELWGYTLVKDTYYGLVITANNFSISGFRIISDPNTGKPSPSYPCISVSGSNARIRGNILENAGAVSLVGSNQTVGENSMTGMQIEIRGSLGNICVNNMTGSSLSVRGNQNVILNNTLYSSSMSVSGSMNTVCCNKISGSMTIGASNETRIAYNNITSGGIALTKGLGSTIENNNIWEGSVSLEKCSDAIIEGNNITQGDITLKGSSNNIVRGNYITEGGIKLDNSVLDYVYAYSSGNVIRMNRIVNGTGLSLVSENVAIANSVENCSSGLTWPVTELNLDEIGSGSVYHNNFVGNAQQFTFAAPAGQFSGYYYLDNGTQGNYWSNYVGNDANGDGIGDSPYVLQEGDDEQFVPFVVDRYPLMFPFDIENDSVVLPKLSPIALAAVISVILAVSIGAGLLLYRRKRRTEAART